MRTDKYYILACSVVMFLLFSFGDVKGMKGMEDAVVSQRRDLYEKSVP